ncbi:uncharacterized protein LOC135388291 isoform X1 [Ornithodoros turicata]|uniref:uncharacterized protein LOC135388291 isoform X1 n=1 Tax=Ornithodoros turicata TaxID=34597 RepID=UPI003139E79F
MMKEGTLIVFHLLIACIFIHVSTEKAAYGKRIGIEARNDCPENERLYSKGTKIEKINGRIVRVEYYTTCHYLCKGKRNNIADGTKCLSRFASASCSTILGIPNLAGGSRRWPTDYFST